MARNNEMIKEISIEEFRDTGLLWWINQQLHLFGIAITVDIDQNGVATRMYPTKCKFRGFPQDSNDRGYLKVTKYMKNNAEKLLEDCEDDWR